MARTQINSTANIDLEYLPDFNSLLAAFADFTRKPESAEIYNIDIPTNTDPLSCLSGDTLVMDSEGELYSLDNLAGEYDSELNVTCIDKHGRLTTSRAHSFRIGQWTDEIYHITLSDGHKIQATGNHPFLGASNEWILTEELEFGAVLRTATYDPKVRNLLLNLNEVTHIHVEKLDEKIPMYDFTVDSHENLFIAQQIDGKVSLVVAHNSSLSVLFNQKD